MDEVHAAVDDGEIEELRRLLAAGADPNLHDGPGGVTLLQSAVDVESDGSAQSGEPLTDTMTALLLEHGADPFLPGQGGETAWDWAFKSTHPLAIARFVQWAADKQVRTPLPPLRLRPVSALRVDAALPPAGDGDRAHLAVEDGDVQALRGLLDAGVDANARHSWSRATLLQRSVFCENFLRDRRSDPLDVTITALLLERGADPILSGCRGESAWDWAHSSMPTGDHHLAIALFRPRVVRGGGRVPRPKAWWEPEGYRWAPPLIDIAGQRNPETPVTDTSLTGWVQPGEVLRLLQWLSHYTGDTRDWSHEKALTRAVKMRNPYARSSDFTYSLQGWPPLTVQLGVLPHHSSVVVTVDGATEATLRYRIAAILDVLGGTPPRARRT
ncbi:hypothetical protein CLV92_1131 [Kineococcus xinjiangensis]|uniref:Uncharacterized protein n=1 Tax=Kineococcus xinjiangensis TaxID=512762 RepID=A0A2S6IEF2_9ACTN|nr:ankyrin repeat domain-containing protein [Kineococcus xinjiangensis]PPK92573.1 hypothetical protein CLV92_1131 [Kineococcus xinjiangensis]